MNRRRLPVLAGVLVSVAVLEATTMTWWWALVGMSDAVANAHIATIVLLLILAGAAALASENPAR